MTYKYIFARSFGAKFIPDGAIAVHCAASPDKPKVYVLYLLSWFVISTVINSVVVGQTDWDNESALIVNPA